MFARILVHLRGNAVAYVALFAALGGTSYAAVRLAPGSVTTRALAPGAVTHGKLARNSVSGRNIANGTLTRADFRTGVLTAVRGSNGSSGSDGGRGPAGPAGPQGPAGANGSASIVLRSRGTGSVTAAPQASTNVPLGNATWTQAANELDIVTGSATVTIPASCTGSFGNSLVVSVDGRPATFAPVPTGPASTTLTLPIVVGPVSEPGAAATHRITAALASSCSKSGENFTVGDVKIDVVAFN
jgi:hypothetical protein